MRNSFIYAAVSALFRQRVSAEDLSVSQRRFDFSLSSIGAHAIYRMGGNDKNGSEGGDYTTVLDRDPEENTNKKEKAEKPKMWMVVIYDDTTTPHAVVKAVLKNVFRLKDNEIVDVIKRAESSHNGEAAVHPYPKEVAEMKVDSAQSYAATLDHPKLRFGMRPE